MFIAVLLISIVSLIAPPVDLEQGYTLRVYDIGRPIDHVARVVQDQTPNADRLENKIDFKDA